MVLTTLALGIISIIFGIAIFIFPKILNYIVGAYFIISGLALLFLL